jgi:hypothetical protein
MRSNFFLLPDYDYILRPTTFFESGKRYMEWGSLFFSFYWRCNLEKVNLDMSKQLSIKSISSLTGFGIKLLLLYINTVDNPKWKQTLVNAIDKANYYDNDELWKEIGKPLGKLVASIFDYEIPNYDFIYGDNERNYW